MIKLSFNKFLLIFFVFGSLISFSQQEIKRDPDTRKDWVNVFYKPQYTLFDLWSDEPIFVSSDGNYHIYYATNENKIPKELVASPQQVSTYSVYKFKNYENCKNWCDGKIYTNENLTPDFQQVDVRASDIQWDDNTNSSGNNIKVVWVGDNFQGTKCTFEKISDNSWVEKNKTGNYSYTEIKCERPGELIVKDNQYIPVCNYVLKDNNREDVYIYLSNYKCFYRDNNSSDWQQIYIGEYTLMEEPKNLDVDGYIVALNDNQKSILSSAIEKQNNKDYYGAISDFTTIIKEEPNFLYAYLLRGGAYSVLNDFNKAIKDETYAINAMSPRYKEFLSKAHFIRGLSYLQINNLNKGCSDLKITINDPEIDQSFYKKYCSDNKNSSNLATSKLTESQSEILKTGFKNLENKNFNAVISDMTVLIQQDPKCILAYFLRGSAYGESKSYNKGINDFTFAINNLTPEHENLRSNLYGLRGLLYIEINQKDVACSDLKIATNSTDVSINNLYNQYCSETSNEVKNNNYSKSNNSNPSSFKFVKPVLNITWVDNRKACCCCNTNMGKYEENKFDNKESAEFQNILENLYVYHKKTNASENVIKSDLERLQHFVANNFSTIVAFGVPVAYPMLKLYELEPSYKLGSKNVRVNIYREINKKCGRCKGFCTDDYDCK